MNSLETNIEWRSYISCLDDDILIQKLVLSHDPDGREFDTKMLLQEVENVMKYSIEPQVSLCFLTLDSFGVLEKTISKAIVIKASNLQRDSEMECCTSNLPAVDGSREQVAYTISTLSLQMSDRKSDQNNLHARTMVVFDLLEKYKWDGKLVLVLASLAANYGRFCLVNQFLSSNELAASVAILGRVPIDITDFKSRIKALTLLVKVMIDVTKCIIEFEGLPTRKVKLDVETESTTKSQMYIAAYWVIRSAFTCSLHIADFRTIGHKHSGSTIAAWELSSLGYRLSKIYSGLNKQVKECQQQLDDNVYEKLLKTFKETHEDNQEVLHLLFALKDDLPLKHSSKQVNISELKGKVTILLISKPELLPLDSLFFLLHQTHDHPQDHNFDSSYQIVWVPISNSKPWTDEENDIYNFLANSLPWYSITKPWLLNSAVLNFIKREWNFQDNNPTMVVLDSEGKMINTNALDMVLIWGAKAYPFSVAREIELWENESWSLKFLVDRINPLLTSKIEEGKTLCIYGSNNLDWIRNFNHKVKKIQSAGVQLEMVYVGKQNPDEKTKTILESINSELHFNTLSFTKIHFLWTRLRSMKKSKLRVGKIVENDPILKEISELLDFVADDDSGWVLIGQGSSTDVLRFQGYDIIEKLNSICQWDKCSSGTFGFGNNTGKVSNEPPVLDHVCGYTKYVRFEDDLFEKVMECENCKRRLKKFIVYE